MTAQRKALRAATVAVIAQRVPAMGGRVFGQRAIPLQEASLPAACVYTAGEQIATISDSTKLHSRRVRLVVHIIGQAHDHTGAGLDDQLDDLADAVEAAIYADSTLGGAVSDVTLTAIEGPDLADSGAVVIGEIRVVYEAVYDTELRDADESLPGLESVRVEYETHAPRAGAEAADLIPIEVAP